MKINASSIRPETSCGKLKIDKICAQDDIYLLLPPLTRGTMKPYYGGFYEIIIFNSFYTRFIYTFMLVIKKKIKYINKYPHK